MYFSGEKIMLGIRVVPPLTIQCHLRGHYRFFFCFLYKPRQRYWNPAEESSKCVFFFFLAENVG